MCTQGGWWVPRPLILSTSSSTQRGGLLQFSPQPHLFHPFPCPFDPLNSPLFSSIQFQNIFVEQPLSVRNYAGGAHTQGMTRTIMCVCCPVQALPLPSPSSQSAKTHLTRFVLLTCKAHFVWRWSLVSGRSRCSYQYFLSEWMQKSDRPTPQ